MTTQDKIDLHFQGIDINEYLKCEAIVAKQAKRVRYLTKSMLKREIRKLNED